MIHYWDFFPIFLFFGNHLYVRCIVLCLAQQFWQLLSWTHLIQILHSWQCLWSISREIHNLAKKFHLLKFTGSYFIGSTKRMCLCPKKGLVKTRKRFGQDQKKVKKNENIHFFKTRPNFLLDKAHFLGNPIQPSEQKFFVGVLVPCPYLEFDTCIWICCCSR